MFDRAVPMLDESSDLAVERGGPFGFLFEDAAVPEDATLALNNW